MDKSITQLGLVRTLVHKEQVDSGTGTSEKGLEGSGDGADEGEDGASDGTIESEWDVVESGGKWVLGKKSETEQQP